MKAQRLHQFGGPEQLQWEEVDDLQPGAGEVRIQVSAAGVNPIDWKTREGGGAAQFQGEPPLILGWEVAGILDQIGADVSGFEAGDRVLGLLNFPQPGKCYAEQVTANAGQLTKVPEEVDLQQAGGLSLAGLTAWQALFDVADLQAGQRVLVTAAAGGVGHLAVQLAKWKGAWVAGTASKNNDEFLQQLGCDQVIDYHQQSPADSLSDIDVVIDGVGGQSAIDALGCLSASGHLVTLPSVTAAEVTEAGQRINRRVSGVRVAPNAKQLQQLVDLVATGNLRLRMDKTFALANASDAHRYSQQGHAQGKIILVAD